ncbi:putative leucine-rich repeat domain superfamily [Helianthus annuus]|nr:putative leucine-rich repeat domain superfamily [Helianthus annuus]KAJ0868496.1 putative leucine-rich repeat domain superfamily [Helianthus annuus]
MAKNVQVFILILVLHVLESALANKFSSLSLADECSLLFQFKESVASWNLNGSDGAGNCCLWDGVECRLGHVIGLNLSSSFLYGPISSNNSLFNLIHLRTLNLANNDFRSSQIPSGIGLLSQLINLNMSNSFFSGEVPKQISHLGNLVSMDLTENYKLTLQGSDFQNLVQNTSETLRELGVFKTGYPKIRISEFRISEIFGYQISLSESVSEISDIRNSDIRNFGYGFG